METNCIYLPYQQTGSFSTIVTDYLAQDEKLKPFYTHAPTLEGIKAAIEDRRSYITDRQLLVDQLRAQYASIDLSALQQQYLDELLLDNTFTICTAHQPNIFTGHLYFIYKILHAIKLADELRQQLPAYNFVPVYYMGSEDADLDELGHITIDGKNYKWNTAQTGAVGRMKVDKAFISLISEMEGQLLIHPYGQELVDLFKRSYTLGSSIQQCTLELVNALFASYGLLVLIPDNAALKQPFNQVVKRELLEQFSYPLVQQTCEALSQHYKVQAGGRPINLFYLIEDKRERIEKAGEEYVVVNLQKNWKEAELLQEVDEHPERFSANVILRGVFQEMILPNIAFIGGGGELAYWMELKEVFNACAVPFPVLVLRNSFMMVNEQQLQASGKLGFEIDELFASTDQLVHTLIKKHNGVKLSLEEEIDAIETVYDKVAVASSTIDGTLKEHVEALRTRHLKHLNELEKKMLRAEKRKYAAEQRQVQKLRDQLFPKNGLQERVDNFSLFYANFGKNWIEKLYKVSLALDQKFAILKL
ncbi:bacillithiol biosynthesis cysteine-adding enzyme BshC [Aridibaculum aurantiacum]|uniref:bacillithiol biosynthesis cysteine-adding enzyme BshC n=1 Tax=Aridibaculum aurantiacum TaxID=2810307 RepID=UPI001A977F33|nr:bacillithiol biosynthesis cysteine-adding enzyme BshC [Aridibaculum aurantiacum]